MKLKKIILLSYLLAILLAGCSKSDNCPSTSTVQISANLTNITIGWDLKLSANYNSLYKYDWTGPNGWSVKNSGAIVTRANLQNQDAGIYEVTVYNQNNCVVQRGSISIIVSPIPDPPCSTLLSDNSCKTNIANVGDFNYSYISFFPEYSNNRLAGYGAKSTAGNGPYIYMYFLGTERPKPGKYKTRFAFSGTPTTQDEVVLTLNDGTGEWYRAATGNDVYVNVVNGKTQICYCSIELEHYNGNKIFSSKVIMNW